MSNQYNYIIIGAGPGGVEAATIANKKGFSVAIIEKQYWGGICLHKGCIPTKGLLHALEKPYEGDIQSLFNRVFDKINLISDNLKLGLAKSGITLYEGEAEIIDNHQVKVNQQIITGDHIIYAGGSMPNKLNIQGINLDNIYDSDTIYQLKTIPQSIAIIGGGYIGFEWADIFLRLNCQVSIYQSQTRVLTGFDEDVKRRLTNSWRKRNITIYENTLVQQFDQVANQIMVTSDKHQLSYDVVFLAVGRKPIKIDLPSDVVKIGDANGGMLLAHKASAEALMIFDQQMNINNIPSVMYTNPEIATVGKCEQSLKQEGIVYQSVKLPYKANSRAFVSEQDEGFIKILYDQPKDLILGVAIVGHQAGELISFFTLAINESIKISNLKRVIFPHPTFCEVIIQALNLI